MTDVLAARPGQAAADIDAPLAAGTSPATSSLWAHIRAQRLGVVAVVGTAKNTGKTVTLNHLMACAAADGLRLGLTSIGRDGEARDAVFSIPKPRIHVWPGTVVATASDTLQRTRARHRRLAATGTASPMGEIVLAQVQEAGEIEVAGPSSGRDQRRVIDLLHRCGSDIVFLDGALGRNQHASPAVADGVVLATGAALGGSLDEVLRKTAQRLALLCVPAADAETCGRCAPVFERGGVGLWRRDGSLLWHAPVASLTAAEALLARDDADLGTVAVSGAVGRHLWQAFLELARRHAGMRVVVADGTRLFTTHADLAALTGLGAQLVAWQPIRLVGITTNPFSPLNRHLDAAEVLAAARRAFPGHAVTDVVLEPGGPIPRQRDASHGPAAT